MSKSRVLVIDDEDDVRQTVALMLSRKGGTYDVVEASGSVEGLERAQKEVFDHVLCDIYMEPTNGLGFLQQAKGLGVSANIIMMSGQADADEALRAIDLGASDYIHKPFSRGQLLFVLRRAEEQARLRRENAFLRAEVEKQYAFHNIVAKSEAMQRIFRVIEKVAEYKTTVLITGESGTGKELVAKAIHYNSQRRKAPFVPINCGGIPDNLLESELFGHVKGAFTDAIRAKKGLFEEANGGTLFLDELGELPLALQVKLLRVLQEDEIRPLGDTSSVKVDVRIVSATARDLAAEVRCGRFREDLYYRINVLPICLPPLRDRREDIPLLVNHFLEKHNRSLRKTIEGVSSDVMCRFLEYAWPGNVREMENLMERAFVLTDRPIIEMEDLPPHLMVGGGAGRQTLPGLDSSALSIKKGSRLLEQDLIKRALEKTKGNKTQAAHLLEISLPALLYKMKDYGLTQGNGGGVAAP